jgi:hypothetical protein
MREDSDGGCPLASECELVGGIAVVAVSLLLI